MWSSDFDEPNPPVSDALVRELETLLGVKLPESYIALMREHNGGFLKAQLVPVNGEVPGDLAGYIDNGFVSVASIAGLNADPDASGSISQTAYMTKEWNLPDRLVLLDGDGHTWVALDYRQLEIDPPVIFLESETGHYMNIATNFADLVEKLIPHEDVFDEDGKLRNAPRG